MNIKYKGKSYQLSTKLRVAFNLQGAFNQKPYTEIFQDLRTANLQEQIKALYVSFDVGNPGVATEEEFLEDYLDNGSLSQTYVLLGDLMDGITFHGMSDAEVAKLKVVEKKGQAQREKERLGETSLPKDPKQV